jgi:chloramphenicol O-acetyltransferase type B
MIEAGRHTIVPDDLATHVPVSIGAFTSIASGCRVVSGQHPGVVEPKAISDFPFAEHGWGEYPASDMGEGIKIDNDVWIGQDVTILDRVWIGSGARIGAGSMVTRNVGPYDVVGGNPATLLKHRFGPSQIGSLLHIKWWDWDDEEIQAALPVMADIDSFIERYDP